MSGTMEVLSTALERAVPWWIFFRRGWFAALVGAFVGMGAGVWFASRAAENVGSAIVVVVLSAAMGALMVGVFLMSWLGSMFPALEVVEPGGTPQGRKVLGGLITLLGVGLGVAGVVLGVLAL